MTTDALPVPHIVSPEQLRDTASSRLIELHHAVRLYVHWALHLAYARIRAATPTADALTVEVLAGPQPRCHLVAVADAAVSCCGRVAGSDKRTVIRW